ncbi:MAG: hypothetical protein U0800_21485 [Isosphaeraceae bacterium]
MLSAYFRDVAHKRTMLGLPTSRDAIQVEAREEPRRFGEFDIECVDVLIGKPDTSEAGGSGKIEELLEQLRMRQLSFEQIETYERQRAAAEKEMTLNEAQAQAAMQAELTASSVQVRIAENQGEAGSSGRKEAEQFGRPRPKASGGSSPAEARVRGWPRRLAEASVLLRKIQSFGDPRLYALAQVAQHLAQSTQPLVPERVFMAGGAGTPGGGSGESLASAGQGMFGLLISMLVAEKSGFAAADSENARVLGEFSERAYRKAESAANKGMDPENQGNGIAPIKTA